jgi:predicted DNA-binding transcriptional regulator YafY
MVTTQSTTVRTVAAKDGYTVPATADQRTDLNDLPICEMLYYRENGGKVSRATLSLVMVAMRDSSAVVSMYAEAKGDLAARCLWPDSITLTRDHNITAHCYCTLRRGWRSFRLDRMLACHALTTPDDIDAAA